jgi:hypothetical protein
MIMVSLRQGYPGREVGTGCSARESRTRSEVGGVVLLRVHR